MHTQTLATGSDSEGDDVQALNALAQQWVEVGWHHLPEEPFDFRRRLQRFYDWSPNGTQFFDDFDPERRVSTQVARYAAIWDERIPSMQYLSNVIVGSPSTLVSGDLAVMSVQFVTSYATSEGVSGKAHTLSSLVWRRTSEGWRIIREHGSGLATQE
ncbi:nuclear transport factor 2 family protein [Xanthomonas theicola]|nr:nuclear transport factor 2 family protein [Xanthomonas theicola]QNH24893.1 nuclear transport factor 2 family protein [Xanthomonas theicola]